MSSRRIHDYAAEQARLRPDASAIVDDARSITFGSLDERRRAVAAALVAAGLSKGERVALLFDKSIEAVVAMLGVNTAGLVYVPLDPASPPERTRRIVERCRPALLVSSLGLAGKAEALLDACPEALRPLVAWLELEAPPAGADEPSLDAVFGPDPLPPAGDDDPESPGRAADPDECAHILFTSGSTGVPKGVMVPHRSVVHFVDWANAYFGTQPGERVSGHSPLFFDLSTYDIYGAIAAGAELHLVPNRLNLLPAKLAGFIRERRLHQWFSVPSILAYVARFDAVREGDFPDLRRVLWCGEVFPTPSLRYWMQRLPDVSFTNLYGPTETTIASSYYTVPACPADDSEDVPIGLPCTGETLEVLDETTLKPVSDGEVGDLFIGGEGHTLGYWEDEETTTKAFVQVERDGTATTLYRTGDLARRDPDSGLVHFLGRKDSQIKSRGYRIELGEIENALHSIDALADAAVVAIPTSGFEGHQICCAYVARETGLEPPGIRKSLAERIPSYMIPSRWQGYDELPKTANGKTDRRALREAFAGETSDE